MDETMPIHTNRSHEEKPKGGTHRTHRTDTSNTVERNENKNAQIRVGTFGAKKWRRRAEKIREQEGKGKKHGRRTCT